MKCVKHVVIILICSFSFSITTNAEMNTDSLNYLIFYSNSPKEQVELLHELHMAYLNIDLDSSLIAAKKAKAISNESNLILDKALSLKLIGNAYLYKGYYTLALDSYFESLDIYILHNDIKGTAHLLNNIAIIYKKTEKYDLALEYFEQTLAIQKTLKDKKSIAIAYGNIGVVYILLSKYD